MTDSMNQTDPFFTELMPKIAQGILDVAGGDKPIFVTDVEMGIPAVGPDGVGHARKRVKVIVVPDELGEEIRQWLESR